MKKVCMSYPTLTIFEPSILCQTQRCGEIQDRTSLRQILSLLHFSEARRRIVPGTLDALLFEHFLAWIDKIMRQYDRVII